MRHNEMHHATGEVMRGLRSVVLGVVLMATVGAAPAVAQGAKFSLGGGLTLPLSDFDDLVGTGWHGLAAVGFQPADFPVGFQIDGMYQRFGFDDVPDDFDANFQIIQGTANVVYTFTTAEESTFHPYLIGGLGLYNEKLTGDDAGDTESENDFGINGGAGFDFQLGSVGLFVEGRFHNVFTEDNSTNFIPITAGIRFGGSGAGS
jgi:Outer membrane protein beta-barrel domain